MWETSVVFARILGRFFFRFHVTQPQSFLRTWSSSWYTRWITDWIEWETSEFDEFNYKQKLIKKLQSTFLYHIHNFWSISFLLRRLWNFDPCWWKFLIFVSNLQYSWCWIVEALLLCSFGRISFFSKRIDSISYCSIEKYLFKMYPD